jgi:hypothetical protein
MKFLIVKGLQGLLVAWLIVGCNSSTSPIVSAAGNANPEILPTNLPSSRVGTPAPISVLEPTITIPPTITPHIIDSPIIKPVVNQKLQGMFGFAPGINPLTGLAAPPEMLNKRPVMVKVSNYPRYGRPHAGLSYADIVFEYYIGEEANRFLALFYSQDAPKIGPVRSGRLVDSQLVNMYGGVLAYGSADPQVDTVLLDELGDRAISFLYAPCPAFCGIDTHSVAGVYSNSAEITKYAIREKIDETRPVLDGMLFEQLPPRDNKNFAVKIGVEYSFRDRGEWYYDPQSGMYLRWIETEGNGYPVNMIPLVDRLNNKQLSFANVIIIYAKYIEYAPTLHQIEIWKNTKGQRALFFRDGIMEDGSWKTGDHNRPIQFYNRYGLPATLKPGNTWIVITGLSSTLEEPQPGQWELKFNLP